MGKGIERNVAQKMDRTQRIHLFDASSCPFVCIVDVTGDADSLAIVMATQYSHKRPKSSTTLTNGKLSAFGSIGKWANAFLKTQSFARSNAHLHFIGPGSRCARSVSTLCAYTHEIVCVHVL